MQQKRSRGLPLDPTLVEQILGFKNVTPKNARYMRNMLESAAKGGHVPPFGPCAMHHPAHQSCLGYIVRLGISMYWCFHRRPHSSTCTTSYFDGCACLPFFTQAALERRSSLPIYLGLNFVPPLLLKRKMWLKQCVALCTPLPAHARADRSLWRAVPSLTAPKSVVTL